jgi:hypothetical protein
MPGEVAAPGTSSGKTGTPSAQTVGTSFILTVNAVDANWNVASNTHTVQITATDPNDVLPANAALVAGTRTFTMTNKTAGSWTATATDTTTPLLTANTSPSYTVNPGVFTKLQLLVPGETAAPGSTAGKTGTPNAESATSAFTVTVNGVDANWNIVNTNDTIRILSSDTSGVLPANAPLIAGARTFSVTLVTLGSSTITASNATHSAIALNTSPAITVKGKLAQTITFAGLSGTTYGAAPLALSATASSGLPVTFSVLSGPATVSGNTLTLTGAGTVTVRASQVGDSSYNPASLDRSFTVSPALLTVTADNKNRLYGAANPALTASYTGFVNGENASVLSGVPSLTTTANASSPPGSYPIIAAAGTLSAANYGFVFVNGVLTVALQQGTQPIVAIHDSELTRALESMPASGATPTGPGTTGFQWWQPAWHYFVMPESVKEALRSDGTAFAVVSDADISAGRLLDTNGQPRYPIVISLASEAVGDDEIAQFTNYVAAGGTLLAGSSAFTRTTNGVSRGDFAFANAMGVHMANARLGNWADNTTFSKSINHPLISHIPGGVLTWNMPTSADEISWGLAPEHFLARGHLCWLVQASDATVIAQGDTNPYLLVKPFGKGSFIYDAAIQPLIGHGGDAPGMYSYCIFRNAIQAAFAAAKAPIPKVSPWPYPYDAALTVRHDLENLQDQINSIAASAQFEYTNGARGDYYFCTGTLRVEMTNNPAAIAGLRRAVTNYGAVIGPHNGGLVNINDYSLVLSNYSYWHWGVDEALDVMGTNLPSGYANGTAYALASTANSFQDVEGWLAGVTNGLRLTVAPYFNATREPSYAIEEQLNVRGSGEQRLSVFPSWVLSTSLQTANKRYPFISSPVSEWYIAEPTVIEAMETGHTPQSISKLVDYYYSLGGLINLYSHSSSAGGGIAGTNTGYYVTYGMSKPRVWGANAASMYLWWKARSSAQISASYTTNGNQSVVTVSISGTTDPQAAVEVLAPGPSVSAVQVLTNGVTANASGYRIKGPVIKLLVGTTVTSAQVSYILNPAASNDLYTAVQGTVLAVPAPGVLANDTTGAGTNLTAVLVSSPTHGVLNLTNNGGLTYTPQADYTGIDTFTYLANDGVTNSAPATVTISVAPPGGLFFDDFSRSTNADPLAPWVPAVGNYTISGGQLQGTNPDVGTYNTVYVTGNWTNFSVQAQLQFPAGAFAGGLVGRVNPVSGANYAVNVYPDGFPGESTSPEMKLLKFHSWSTLGSSAMQTVSLPMVVGTSPHTLQLIFRGSRIMVYFDGVQVMDVTDNGFDGLPAYLSGGIGAHFYEHFSPYVMTWDNMLVSALPPTPLAVNDSYSVVQNRTLAVAAPGVLNNDVAGAGTNLIAVLVTGATNGTINLSTNGGFTYTPQANYLGTDSFTYQAADSVSNSTPALVTITVTSNSIPIANNDSYDYVQNTTLTVGAPGVLANDTDADGDSLSAALVSAPAFGTLNLSPDGGFTYTPATNFNGTDSFTYVANDGSANSGVATVTLANPALGAFFYDNFTGATDPGPLTPWVAQSGNWMVTGGVLRGGTDPLSTYASAYLTNNWTDYSVEGRFQFATDAYGGGLGGRLNPVTGARYAAWIYPSGNVLNLVKFAGWQNASYPGDFLVQLLPLPAIGTNWHALKLAFQGNQIAVYYDGSLMASVTDAVNPYVGGGVSVDMYTDTTPYLMSVAEVLVKPLVTGGNYSMQENATLAVPAPGLLGNDTGVYGTNLTATLLRSPTNGTLYLTNNGGFSYTPSNNYVGPDSFTYQANDGPTNLGTATVSVAVVPANITPPVVAITGTVAYYPSSYPSSDLSTNRVGNVTMSLTGDTNLSGVTLADGSYGLSNIWAGGTYCVTPSKTNDSAAANGITGTDLSIIQAYILNKLALNPYQLLAADVNANGKITGTDLSLIQAVILGARTNFPAGLWRFVPADYVFPDPANPWNAPSQRWHTNLVADVTNGDFVAIKLGDVNNSWKAPAPAGGQSLVLNRAKVGAALAAAVPEVLIGVGHQSAQPGQTVIVGVTVSGFHQVTSAQFSLAWDPAVLRYVGTGSYGLAGLSAGSFGTTLAESGKLAFAWYDPAADGVTLADGRVLFSATFEVIGKVGSVSAVALAGTPATQEVSVDFALAVFGAQDGSVAVVGPGALVNKPGYANGAFRLSVPTEQGRSYTLEFTDSLTPTNWTALPAVAGDGTVTVLVDPAATNQQRFYRVHVR